MLDLSDNFPGGVVLEHATEALRTELYSNRDFVLSAVRENGAEVLDSPYEMVFVWPLTEILSMPHVPP